MIDCPPPVRRSVNPNPLVHARVFALAFLVLIAVGTVLLMLPWATATGQETGIVDALFLSMSASSVTGMATVDTATHWTFFGELVILLLTQIGGIGFMVGASLVLRVLGRGSTLRDTLLLRDGAPTLTVGEALELSGRVARFIVVVEAIGATLLTGHFWLAADMPFLTALWFGIFYSVCSFCNDGFDLSGDFSSLIAYDDAILVNVVIATLIQAGSLSYFVFHDLWKRRRWRLLALDTKLVLALNAIVLGGGATVFLVAEWNASLVNTPV